MTATANELTYGQKIVGANFNPSKNTAVDAVKQAHANVIDTLKSVIDNSEDPMQVEIAQAAIQDQLRAQMMAVKALTFNL